MNTAWVVLLLLPLPYTLASIDRPHSKYHELSDKEILDHLLHKQRYDKRIKAPSEGSLRVNISMVLLSLSSPDESSLHYEVEFIVHQRWIDPRLVHDDGNRYPTLNALHHHGDIWKPDIYFIKHGTFKEGLLPSNIALKIHRNGTVIYSMRRHLVLNCEGDLHIFPFDSPMCTFGIESVSFTRRQMEFHWAGPNRIHEGTESGSLALSPVLKRHNAYMVHNETTYCTEEDEWRGDYSCLKVRLHFTRDKFFYMTTVFIPGIILVTSSFLSFWLDWTAVPARVMLGVTTMLNFFTTSNGFRSNLPVVSNLTAMNAWDGISMGFIYCSFMEFVAVNYLGRWVQDPNNSTKKKENAILDSLKIVSSTLDQKQGQLGAGLHHLGGELEHRLNEVKAKIPKEIEHKLPGRPGQKSGLSEDSTMTMMSSCSSTGGEAMTLVDTPKLQREDSDKESEPQGYSLKQVQKIDVYSRKVFPILYGIFVFYFFIRYYAIEGALSIDY